MANPGYAFDEMWMTNWSRDEDACEAIAKGGPGGVSEVERLRDGEEAEARRGEGVVPAERRERRERVCVMSTRMEGWMVA